MSQVSPDPAARRAGLSRRRFLEGSAALLGTLALPATMSPLACPAAAATALDRLAAPPNGFPEWNNNIGIFEIGTEPPHATLMPYADLEQALAADRTRSPYRLDLDGDWKFQHADRPDDRDPDFHRDDVDDSAWADHPGPVELAAARLRLPDLRQHHLPLVGRQRAERERPAAVRADAVQPGRPVPPDLHGPGRLAGTADVPALRGRQVRRSTCGSTASWSATARTRTRPAEFDITEHLRPGTNRIAVEVYRFPDGDWMEDQDMIRLTGIFRSVYLYSTPAVHLRDFRLDTPLRRRLHQRRPRGHRPRARLRRRRQAAPTRWRPSSTTRTGGRSGHVPCGSRERSARRRPGRT